MQQSKLVWSNCQCSITTVSLLNGQADGWPGVEADLASQSLKAFLRVCLLRGKRIIFISLCWVCFVDGPQSLDLLAEPLFYLWLVIRNLWAGADFSIPISCPKCQHGLIVVIRSQESRRLIVFYFLDAYLITQQGLPKMGELEELRAESGSQARFLSLDFFTLMCFFLRYLCMQVLENLMVLPNTSVPESAHHKQSLGFQERKNILLDVMTWSPVSYGKFSDLGVDMSYMRSKISSQESRTLKVLFSLTTLLHSQD